MTMRPRESLVMWKTIHDKGRGAAAMTAAHDLGVPDKRLYRWLEKWESRGWWECGVSLRSGWVPTYEDQYDGRNRLEEMRVFLHKHTLPELLTLLPERASW